MPLVHLTHQALSRSHHNESPIDRITGQCRTSVPDSEHFGTDIMAARIRRQVTATCTDRTKCPLACSGYPRLDRIRLPIRTDQNLERFSRSRYFKAYYTLWRQSSEASRDFGIPLALGKGHGGIGTYLRWLVRSATIPKRPKETPPELHHIPIPQDPGEQSDGLDLQKES